MAADHGLPALLDFFLELCALPSPSGQERAVADRVGRYLTDLGLEWDEDDTAAELQGTAGSIYCRIPGENGSGRAIFLCAHTDTVPPDGRLEPVVDEGIVRNAGGTILGSDNKAAVVAMLEAVRRILDDRRPHGGIELVFTPKEEVGLQGAAAFDHTRLAARTGFVYDQGTAIGEIVLGSPHAYVLDLRFHGRSAHAGMFPEEGRSAVAAASRAIADFRLGRIDEETSANVGVITGGTARNVVPEWCSFEAEIRSHDEQKATDSCARCSRPPRSQPASASASSSPRFGRASPGTASGRATTPCGSRQALSPPVDSLRAMRSPGAAPTRTSSTRAASSA